MNPQTPRPPVFRRWLRRHCPPEPAVAFLPSPPRSRGPQTRTSPSTRPWCHPRRRPSAARPGCLTCRRSSSTCWTSPRLTRRCGAVTGGRKKQRRSPHTPSRALPFSDSTTAPSCFRHGLPSPLHTTDRFVSPGETVPSVHAACCGPPTSQRSTAAFAGL